MLEFIVELLAYSIAEPAGRAVVYVVTVGRVRCEGAWAEVIGFVFWFAVLLGIVALIRG